MKILFMCLSLLFVSNSAVAGQIFIDQINGYWAYVCQEANERWTCKDVQVGALEIDYRITQSIEHGWFDVVVEARQEK